MSMFMIMTNMESPGRNPPSLGIMILFLTMREKRIVFRESKKESRL